MRKILISTASLLIVATRPALAVDYAQCEAMNNTANQLLNNNSAIYTLRLRVIMDSQDEARRPGMTQPIFMGIVQNRVAERLNKGEGGDDAQRAWSAIKGILADMKTSNCPQLAGSY